MFKVLFRNIDVVLFCLLLFYDFEAIIAIFDASKPFKILDIVFNIWFVLLIVIIYRRLMGKEFLDSILYDLGFKSKKKDDK